MDALHAAIIAMSEAVNLNAPTLLGVLLFSLFAGFIAVRLGRN